MKKFSKKQIEKWQQQEQARSQGHVANNLEAEGPAEVQTAYGKVTDMRELLMDEMRDIFTEFAGLVASECTQMIASECAEICANIDGGENMFSRAIRREFGVE